MEGRVTVQVCCDDPELQESFRQKNPVFWNTGAQFVDVSDTAGSGLQVAKSSRGLAVGGLDDDGDLIVSNIDDTPTVLRNQQQTAHHWLEVQLEQRAGNRFCIGARDGRDGRHTQVREIQIWGELSLTGRSAGTLRTGVAHWPGGRRGANARRRRVALAASGNRSRAQADTRR